MRNNNAQVDISEEIWISSTARIPYMHNKAVCLISHARTFLISESPQTKPIGQMEAPGLFVKALSLRLLVEYS